MNLSPFWTAVVHGAVSLVLFGVPLLLTNSTVDTLTIGTILNAVYHWAVAYTS